MNLLKTLRPTAYALLGMISLTLSASAQDYTIQNAIEDANATATQYGATQNQKNLFVALAKVDFLFFQNLTEADLAGVTFDNKGFASGNPANKVAYYNTQLKIYNVLFGSNGEATEAQIANTSKTFLNQLSPGLYTALPTILFNSANVQNTQIQQRLWAVRAGMSQDQVEAPVADGGKSATMSGKKVVAPVAEPDQKWVTFADGNGMWSQAQSVNNLPGYNTYAGGVQVGASYELFKGLNVGPYVGYQGTKVNFNGSNGGGSTATDNSVRYGLFGEFVKGGWYTDGIIGGAYNSVDVNHGISISGNGNTFNSMAKGNVAGGEFDSMLGTGYEFKAGKLTFGPATSLQYTYLQLGGTQETGAGALNQNIGSQNASSLLYTLGAQAHYDLNITQTVKLQPFGSLAWQHEFLQNGYNLSSSIGGQSYNYQTTNAGRDQFIAGIGGNLILSKSLSAYAICNLINSDAQIFSQAISAGVNLKF
ncbi:MAG: autotransporter outer membrane beta-barrel domain-containing protein [Chthoniobacterales bacterium]|nr:autotransporter outer membrane beta-barrel domain-containing protein [Chthoniobacterales bacterium]